MEDKDDAGMTDSAESPTLQLDHSSAGENTSGSAGGASHSGVHMPFFADVVMDLSEAHDFAETPEPSKPTFIASTIPNSKMHRITIPSLGMAEQQETRLDPAVAPMPVSLSPPSRGLTKRDRESSTSHNDDNDNDDDIENHNQAPQKTFARISNFETDLRTMDLPKTRPRWPRDIPWAVAFLIYCPLALAWPILHSKHHHNDNDNNNNTHIVLLSVHPLSTATLHTLVWAGIATALLSRSLYRTAAGGDGDDARHVVASALTLWAPVASVAVHLALVVLILVATPHARWAALVPAWYTLRDVYLFRRWRRRNDSSFSTTAEGSRPAFFQALTGMALDILSRSLRRASFYRVLWGICVVQFVNLWLWRWALLAALQNNNNNQPTLPLTLVVALVGFKWVSGTVSRMLTLLASGGVMGWFAEQSRLALRDDDDDYNDDGFQSNTMSEGDAGGFNITEAYRTVNASVYTSVAEMDDVLDDDYEADDDEFLEAPSQREYSRRDNQQQGTAAASTVKSILHAGLTVSFGSVAQCGLLGGLAQFAWSQVRKVESSQALVFGRGGDAGFQGMPIGTDDTLVAKIWARINAAVRGFVKRYSDLAMCHVAAYYKSYQRAARDVATLIENSGTCLARESRSCGQCLSFFPFFLLSLSEQI